jgi:hypothetical protein
MSKIMRAKVVYTLLFAFSTSIFAQVKTQINKNTSYQEELGNKIFEDQSLDHSLKFGGYLSAVANFAGVQNNTITLQPTLYALNNLLHGWSTTIDTTYAKEIFLRNSQIDLGFTPNAKNLFAKPSDYQVGFTYAILNNKDIPLEDFDISSGPWKRFSDMLDTLYSDLYELRDQMTKDDFHRICSIADNGYYELLPDSIYRYLKGTYGDVLSRNFQKNIIDSLANELSRQSLLTVSGKATYKLSNYWWDDFTFKATFSKYILSKKGSFVDPSIDVTASYSMQDDTTKVGKNSDRQTVQLLVELNLRGSMFEIRPGISFTHVPNGLYEKEKQDKISPTAEFDLKIAAKTIVAFTMNYDNDTKKVTGGLKIQGSLK